jgi:hypothetical protein
MNGVAEAVRQVRCSSRNQGPGDGSVLVYVEDGRVTGYQDRQ